MTADPISFPAAVGAPPNTLEPVELIGAQLRINGWVEMGRFHRLSDLVAAGSDSIRLRRATVLNRRGMSTSDQVDLLHVRLNDVTLIAQRRFHQPAQGSPELMVAKVVEPVTLVTPTLRVAGDISLYPGVDQTAYLQGSDPPFLALRSAAVRWLADRRLKAGFEFALVNRTHVVAFVVRD
jgi:hypothetical protein